MRFVNNFGFDEDAVSPVVGVILMVAITVILAAVIGTFVLDLGGQVQQNAQAGVSFDETEGVETEVQLNSVQNADHIYVEAPNAATTDSNVYNGGDSSLGASQYGSGPGTATQYLLTVADGSGSTYSSGDQAGGVGTTVTVKHDDSGDGQITVIGVIDGSENIIQTYSYTGGN